MFSYPSIGTEVGCRDLQRDRELNWLGHLLHQEVRLTHQRVGLHDVFFQLRKTLTEQLLPDIPQTFISNEQSETQLTHTTQ